MKKVLIFVGIVALSFTTGCIEWFFGDGYLEPPRETVIPEHTETIPDTPEERELYPGANIRVAVAALGVLVISEEIKEVSSQYEITMPYLGAVNCRGLKLRGLEEKLAKAYETIYREPSVTVYYMAKELSDGSSPFGVVHIVGCVGNPGPVNIPATRDLSLLRALQLAGNPTRVANTTKVILTRVEDGKEKLYKIDLTKIGQPGYSHYNMQLRAGDYINVPESIY